MCSSVALRYLGGITAHVFRGTASDVLHYHMMRHHSVDSKTHQTAAHVEAVCPVLHDEIPRRHSTVSSIKTIKPRRSKVYGQCARVCKLW